MVSEGLGFSNHFERGNITVMELPRSRQSVSLTSRKMGSGQIVMRLHFQKPTFGSLELKTQSFTAI